MNVDYYTFTTTWGDLLWYIYTYDGFGNGVSCVVISQNTGMSGGIEPSSFDSSVCVASTQAAFNAVFNANPITPFIPS